MKKLFKIAAVFLGLVILAIGCLAVALPYLLPPEKARAFLESKLTQSLGREVRFETVSVGLFSGLSVTGFRLSELPTFDQGTLLSCEQVSLKPRLLPLLAGQILVRDIGLVQPVLRIVRREDGSLNLTHAGASTATTDDVAEPVPSTTEKTLPAFLISRLRVEKGQVAFVDKSTAAMSAILSNIDLTARHVSLTGPVETQLALDAEGQGLKGHLEATARLKPLSKTAALDRLRIETSSGTVTLTGEASLDKVTFNAKLEAGPLKAGAEGTLGFGEITTITAKISAPDLPIGDVLKRLPPGSMPADVRLSGPVDISAVVNGTPDSLTFDASINGTDLETRYGESFVKPAGVGFQVQASGKAQGTDTIRANTLTILLAGMDLKGPARYDASGVSAELAAEDFDLAPVAALLPSLRDYSVAGTARLKTRMITGNTPTTQATVELKKGSARYEKSNLTELAATARYNNGLLDVPRLTGKLNGSPFEMKLSGRTLDTHPVVATTIRIDELDIEKLMPADTTPKKTRRPGLFVSVAHAAAEAPLIMDLSGTLSAANVTHPFYLGQKMEASWDLKNVTEDLSRIEGKASLRQGPGTVKNIQKLIADSKAARLILTPLAVLKKLEKTSQGLIRLPSFEQVSFRDLSGDYTFDKGTMNVRRFDLHGSELDASLTGTAGLAGAQALNMDAKLKIPAKTLGSGAEAIQESDGRVAVGAKIRGTLLAPEVKLDYADIAKKTLNAVGSKILEKLGGKQGEEGGGEDQPDKVDELLKGLFKKR